MEKLIYEYRFDKIYLFSSLFILLLLLLFILNINISELPDYAAYEKIYYGILLESISIGDWEPFFILINFISNYFGLKYENYRIIVLFISIILWFLSYKIIISKEKKYILFVINQNSLINFRIRNYSILLNILIIFSIVLFMFEFYIIRIRAGLAISFFLFAIAILWNRSDKISISNLILSFLLLLISSQTHFFTFVILSYLVLFPYLIAKIYMYTKLKYKINLKFLIYVGLYILSAFILSSIIDSVGINRIGADSELNPVRFFGIAIIPLSFVLYKSKKLFLNLSIHRSKSDEFYSFKDIYYYFMFFNYFCLIIVLVFFYFFGLIGMAGEAIVRVYSLAYIPAFLVTFNSNKKYTYFWLIIVLVNAFFFEYNLFIKGKN